MRNTNLNQLADAGLIVQMRSFGIQGRPSREQVIAETSSDAGVRSFEVFYGALGAGWVEAVVERDRTNWRQAANYIGVPT